MSLLVIGLCLGWVAGLSTRWIDDALPTTSFRIWLKRWRQRADLRRARRR